MDDLSKHLLSLAPVLLHNDCLFIDMKLKNYLSTKKLRKKLSRFNVNESQCKINDSFTDYNDNDITQETVTKDDLYLRPKRKGGVGVRSDMTQSFAGCLPTAQTNTPSTATLIDHGSQTSLESLSDASSCQTSFAMSINPRLCIYKDNIAAIELGSIDSVNTIELTSRGDNYSNSNRVDSQCSCSSCLLCQDRLYNSLPSSQTSYHHIQDVSYTSLPLACSMTQSIYIGSNETTSSPVTATTATAPAWKQDRNKRSRIKTNPWLPLPKDNSDILYRTRHVNKKAEPRLSRFFSEVCMRVISEMN